MIDGRGISCEIALIWMSLDFTWTTVDWSSVMSLSSQATSHYQRPRSLSPYGVTRPEWVNGYMKTIGCNYISMPLTKQLDGSVCTPGQLQWVVNAAMLIDGSTIPLQKESWTGSFWDDGNVLGRKIWSNQRPMDCWCFWIHFRLSAINSLRRSDA